MTQTTVATLTAERDSAQAELDALNAALAQQLVKLALFQRGIMKNTDKKSLIAIGTSLKAEATGIHGDVKPVNGNFAVAQLQAAIVEAKERELGVTSAYERMETLESQIADLTEAINNADRYELLNRLLGDAVNGSIFEQCETTRQVLINVGQPHAAEDFTSSILRNSFRNTVSVMSVIYDYLLFAEQEAARQPEPVATGKKSK